MHSRYPQWLTYVFDRVTAQEPWYFDIEVEPFEADVDDLVQLIALTCINSGTDLQAYSDAQVNAGLDYMFNPTCSDTVFALRAPTVSLDTRLHAIRSLKHLYADCFEKRCTEALSHRNDGSVSDLNEICYMLWDVTPIARWPNEGETAGCLPTSLDVLRSALESPNTACIESALHGLGHLHAYARQAVESTIDAWVGRLDQLPRQLAHYAAAARAGQVQ